MSIIIGVLTIILTPVVYWLYVLYKYKSLASIKGPTPVPLIGNIFAKNGSELFKQFLRITEEYGPLYKVFTGPQVRIVICKPKHMEFIMSSTKHITKSDGYNFFIPWLGDGLLLSTGQKWKDRRRLITPTFHFKILDEFLDTFNSAGEILIKQLSKEVKQKSVDIYQKISLHSLDIICETAMGTKINTQENQNSEYFNAVRGFLKIFMIRFFSFWYQNDLLFRLFSPEFADHEKFVKILLSFTDKVIEKKRQEYNTRQNCGTTEDEFGIKKKVALLDLLLESENSNRLTNEDLREEINTFMFEGHDTVTSGISFTLLELAKNPDVQQKLYEEILNIVGPDDPVITTKHLQEMKYLDMVVKEGLRKIPSVPFIERLVETDAVMDGINLPKGTVLLMFIYALHHDPEIYPDPETFDPDRFLLENQIERSNFAFVPFSAGLRNCIGQKFAYMEMKVAIAKVLQHFELVAIPGFEMDLEMTGIFKSRNGVYMELRKRKI